MIALGAAAVVGVVKLKNYAMEYTDTRPLEFAQTEISAESLAELTNRIDSFMNEQEEGISSGNLVLTENEVNAIIDNHEDFKELKSRVKVHFRDDKVSGEVSIPLDELPFGWGDGRYLNGSAAFIVTFNNGVLIVAMDALEVKGRQVPEEIMSEIRNANLAKDLYEKVETARLLERLQRIEIINEKLIIEFRPEGIAL